MRQPGHSGADGAIGVARGLALELVAQGLATDLEDRHSGGGHRAVGRQRSLVAEAGDLRLARRAHVRRRADALFRAAVAQRAVDHAQPDLARHLDPGLLGRAQAQGRQLGVREIRAPDVAPPVLRVEEGVAPAAVRLPLDQGLGQLLHPGDVLRIARGLEGEQGEGHAVGLVGHHLPQVHEGLPHGGVVGREAALEQGVGAQGGHAAEELHGLAAPGTVSVLVAQQVLDAIVDGRVDGGLQDLQLGRIPRRRGADRPRGGEAVDAQGRAVGAEAEASEGSRADLVFVGQLAVDGEAQAGAPALGDEVEGSTVTDEAVRAAEDRHPAAEGGPVQEERVALAVEAEEARAQLQGRGGGLTPHQGQTRVDAEVTVEDLVPGEGDAPDALALDPGAHAIEGLALVDHAGGPVALDVDLGRARVLRAPRVNERQRRQ